MKREEPFGLHGLYRIIQHCEGYHRPTSGFGETSPFPLLVGNGNANQFTGPIVLLVTRENMDQYASLIKKSPDFVLQWSHTEIPCRLDWFLVHFCKWIKALGVRLIPPANRSCGQLPAVRGYERM